MDTSSMYRPSVSLTLLSVLLVLLVSPVYPYSRGAPDGACSRMIPNHGVQPSNSPAPYVVSTSKNTVKPGETITVTITPSGNGAFKGFFIRATQADRYLQADTFVESNDGGLRCAGQGITHKDPNDKTTVTVSWTAPQQLSPTPVVFKATVVQERASFWVDIKSPEVAVDAPPTTGGGVTTAPPTGNTVPPNQGVTTSDDDDDDEDDDDNAAPSFKNPGRVQVDEACNNTKGCFHNCGEGKPCTYFMSWHYQKNVVRFEFLYKTTSRTDQWIAIGLSKDTHMGDDSVLECVMEDDKVLIKTSYNEGQFNLYPDDKAAGLSQMSGSVRDGVLGCAFTRNVSYPREPKVFDLGTPYYLFVAHGEAVAGNKFPHSYDKLPEVSSKKIHFENVGHVAGSKAEYPMIKAHGSAMTVAWVVFASSGMAIARHGRAMFNGGRPCGLHVWFHIHRFCMVMTALLTLGGFVLILVESKGYSHITENADTLYRIIHPPLGLILIVLTFVNPLMAIARPDPKSPSRPMFKWTHWGFGMFAWFASFVLILVGLDLPKAQCEIWATYILVGFIGYLVLFEILVRALPIALSNFCTWVASGCCRSNNSYDLNVMPTTNGEIPSITGNGISQDRDLDNHLHSIEQRRENALRTTLLILHILLCAGSGAGILYYLLRDIIEDLLFHRH